MDRPINAICWLPKLPVGQAPGAQPPAAAASASDDQAQWSVTVHRDYIEGTTGAQGRVAGGSMGARFDRRTGETATTTTLRAFGIDRTGTKPGGLAQLRRAVEACAERYRGTDNEAGLRAAADELAAAAQRAPRKP